MEEIHIKTETGWGREGQDEETIDVGEGKD